MKRPFSVSYGGKKDSLIKKRVSLENLRNSKAIHVKVVIRSTISSCSFPFLNPEIADIGLPEMQGSALLSSLTLYYGWPKRKLILQIVVTREEEK